MNKKVLLALLMVAFLAVPAFASVQNVKVSGDIDSSWLVRDNFDLGITGPLTNAGTNLPGRVGDRRQNVFLTQTRLRVDADLTDNVSTHLGIINERPWDAPSGANTDIDLNVAKVTLRDVLSSPLTIHAGRMNDVRYGNGLVFDSTGTNNQAPADSALSSVANDLTKQTALDGIRGVLDFNPLTIDLVYFKVDANTLTGAADRSDDVDLYGTNLNYSFGDDWNTTAEAYFFARIDKSTQTLGSSGNKSDTVYLPGLRASTNPIKGLNVQGEVAWQRGNFVLTTTAVAQNQDREAMAAQAIVNYQVPLEATAKWNPVLTGVYTYLSGDSNPALAEDTARPASDEKYTAWDPFFENQAGGSIYNTLFDLTNDHILTASASVVPMEDVTAKVTWTGLWLDRELRGSSFAIRQPDGGTLTVANNTDEKGLGFEVDAELTYDYTEDVQVGLNLGWFNPGDVFAGTNDSTAKQAILHAGVAF